ncbi:hypothetical protein KWH45_01075 [Xanthomonas campestris pv. mirabilis]|uniref:hypothetical protein n=1 Tax=Xanthomonas euvesicatoria TaxID=456327 RepID=UPI001C464761|nr:hypothetical protein [Xanthomonas euvesicatoria]MBV6852051.1 hypothetical protein [Xanthomonas campestris pv. mirabilis]
MSKPRQRCRGFFWRVRVVATLKRTHPNIHYSSRFSQPPRLRDASLGYASRWPTEYHERQHAAMQHATSEFRVANATGVSLFHPPQRETP